MCSAGVSTEAQLEITCCKTLLIYNGFRCRVLESTHSPCDCQLLGCCITSKDIKLFWKKYIVRSAIKIHLNWIKMLHYHSKVWVGQICSPRLNLFDQKTAILWNTVLLQFKITVFRILRWIEFQKNSIYKSLYCHFWPIASLQNIYYSVLLFILYKSISKPFEQWWMSIITVIVDRNKMHSHYIKIQFYSLIIIFLVLGCKALLWLYIFPL